MNEPSPPDTGALARSLAEGLAAGGSGFRHNWLFRPLLRLLAHGAPVPVAAIARVTGRPEETVRAALADWPDTEYDDAGAVVGHGITLDPTPHRFNVAGVELYTWCALDTLMFPGLLGRPALVESPCHASGLPVRMTVHPTDGVAGLAPETAVVSVVVPDTASSVRTGFCAQVHFFGDGSLAEDWRAGRPGATVLPVADAYRLGRELHATLIPDAAGLDPEQASQ